MFGRPDGLERFGGAYLVTNLLDELNVIQRHFSANTIGLLT